MRKYLASNDNLLILYHVSSFIAVFILCVFLFQVGVSQAVLLLGSNLHVSSTLGYFVWGFPTATQRSGQV